MRNGSYVLLAAPDGYPGKKYRGKYAYEHHLVWWQVTGETISPHEVILHRNGDPLDNRFDNLERVTRGSRGATQSVGMPGQEGVTCGHCGRGFILRSSRLRTRMAQSKSGKIFCSRACGTKEQRDRFSRVVSRK